MKEENNHYEDESNIVELIDDEGNTLQYEHLMTFEYKKEWYVALTQVTEPEEAEEDDGEEGEEIAIYHLVGGEDDETPPEAARRELFEETGIRAETLLPLKSLAYIRTNVYSAVARAHWPDDLYVLPEYSFAFECG